MKEESEGVVTPPTSSTCRAPFCSETKGLKLTRFKLPTHTAVILVCEACAEKNAAENAVR